MVPRRVRAFFAMVVVVLALVLSIEGSVGAQATADAFGAHDACEAEPGADEDRTSDEDAARPQPTDGLSSASGTALRMSACVGSWSDDGHRMRLFRPPNP